MLNCASAVWLECPNGIVLVKDTDGFGEDAQWKFPGGRSKSEDGDEKDTGIREIKEETGLVLHRDNVELLGLEDRRTHFFFLLVSSVESLEGLLKRGDEGEEVRVFSRQDFLEMLRRGEILESHARVIPKNLLVP